MTDFKSRFNIGDKVTYEGIYGDIYTATIESVLFQHEGVRYYARNRKDVVQTFTDDDIELKQ